LAGFIAWCAIVALASLATLGYLGLQKSQLASAEKKFKELDVKVNSSENVAFRKEAQEVQASLVSLNQLYDHQIKNSAVISEVSAITPKSVKLISIDIVDTGMTINGEATSYPEVGKMVAAFKESQKLGGSKKVYFTDIIFNGSSLKGSAATFSMTMKYVYPDETSGVNYCKIRNFPIFLDYISAVL
jgi:hypothetical protein